MKTLATWLVTVALAACAVPAAAQTGAVIQKIIVKVNGDLFTLTELEQRQIEELMAQNISIQNPDDIASDAALQSALNQATPLILVNAVDELMLVQRARELGVQFNDDAFNDALEQIQTQNGLTEDGLLQAMSEQGMTMASLRQNLERDYMIGGVQQVDILPALTLTDEEMRQYYEANPAQFMQDETVMLREIFVEVPTEVRDGQPVVNVAVDEAALAKIQSARARSLAGEDYENLVAEVSESTSKDRGGLIGPIRVAELAPAMVEVINGLAVTDISEPIRTSRGYQMLMLESRTAAEPQAFTDVREEIRQFILEGRMEEETVKYLAGLRDEAVIEWKDDTYRALYEAHLAARDARSGVGGGGLAPGVQR